MWKVKSINTFGVNFDFSSSVFLTFYSQCDLLGLHKDKGKWFDDNKESSPKNRLFALLYIGKY